jgi:hypothetical protein
MTSQPDHELQVGMFLTAWDTVLESNRWEAVYSAKEAVKELVRLLKPPQFRRLVKETLQKATPDAIAARKSVAGFYALLCQPYLAYACDAFIYDCAAAAAAYDADNDRDDQRPDRHQKQRYVDSHVSLRHRHIVISDANPMFASHAPLEGLSAAARRLAPPPVHQVWRHASLPCLPGKLFVDDATA